MAKKTVQQSRDNKKSSPLFKVVLVLCIVGALVCGGIFLSRQMQIWNAEQDVQEPVLQVLEPGKDLVENPIDFEALQQENADIYAWVSVPGTKVNYPILQHPTDDGHYLYYNKDGARSVEGAIYTEIKNAKDFTDPVTVVYGHNIKGGLMFNTLHKFEDKAFFDENPEFYIYTPGHILTYRIVSANGADDAHILNTNDFTNEEALLAYFDSLQNPSTNESNVRTDVPLDAASKIVQLSTCNYTDGNERYIVTGVLVDDQPTY